MITYLGGNPKRWNGTLVATSQIVEAFNIAHEVNATPHQDLM